MANGIVFPYTITLTTFILSYSGTKVFSPRYGNISCAVNHTAQIKKHTHPLHKDECVIRGST